MWSTILFQPNIAQAATLLPEATPFVPNADEFVSAMVMLPKTHQVLWSFKPDKPHPAASLTKLANALALVRLNPAWDRIVAIRSEDEVGGGRLRVKVGARLSVQDALFSSITASANNAAATLARTSRVGTIAYVRRMNDEAKRAGAKQSSFVDPSGMDPKNRTTARDMALIAETAFKNPMIRRAASTGTYRFAIRNTGELKQITNTNHLLTRDPDIWVVGGKTGYLEESKYNFVARLKPVDADGDPVAGKDVLVVVFGAPTKEGSFATAKRLADWAWHAHDF